jgi:hypothetical protein
MWLKSPFTPGGTSFCHPAGSLRVPPLGGVLLGVFWLAGGLILVVVYFSSSQAIGKVGRWIGRTNLTSAMMSSSNDCGQLIMLPVKSLGISLRWKKLRQSS